MLDSCIGVSDYNEQYLLCQPLFPSPLSSLGLTRSTQRHTTPLYDADTVRLKTTFALSARDHALEDQITHSVVHVEPNTKVSIESVSIC